MEINLLEVYLWVAGTLGVSSVVLYGYLWDEISKKDDGFFAGEPGLVAVVVNVVLWPFAIAFGVFFLLVFGLFKLGVAARKIKIEFKIKELDTWYF